MKNARKYKIFVVEDESIVSLEIQNRLNDLGFDVVGSAASGEKALVKIPETFPDLVLMDIRLKGSLDGIETAGRLKEWSDIPVIFLTAYADDDTLQRAKEHAPYGYLIKPFEERELYTSIEIALFRYEGEKKLRDKDRLLITILRNIGDAVITTDTDGNITFMNEIAEKNTGYKSKESVGKKNETVYKIFDKMTVVKNDLEKNYLLDEWEKIGLNFSKALIDREGNTFPIKEIISPLKDEKETIHGTLIVFKDLTDKKNAQEKILEVEYKFKKIVENSPEILYTFSTESGISYISPRVSEILGYGQDEFEKNPGLWGKLFYPKDLPLYSNRLQHCIKFKKTSLEYRLKDITGKWKWFWDSITLISNDNGNYLFQGFASDISERKLAEEMITLQRSALNSAYNGIFITDREGEIVWCNDAISRITGYSIDEIIGAKPSLFKSEKQDKDFYFHMWRTLLNGNVWAGEIINKRKNGENYYEESIITPVKNIDNTLTHFIAIKQDITERKKFEQQLIQAKEQAEKSDKLKSEFLAQMSHEIRTPISSITSFTNLLRSELEDKVGDDIKLTFDMIDLGSKRLIRTIDLILNMSSIQTDTYQLELVNLELCEDVIKPVIKDFMKAAAVKGLDLKLRNKLKTSRILKLDQYSMSQIFVNLIDNAIKYTNEGFIEITVEQNKSGNLKVTIEDSGIGISKEYLRNLFRPFSQEEQGYTRSYEGNGLGLALVKNYCTLNKADISVDSIKGKGTKVTIVFEQ
ncbi:MAG: PAS domain S-box protein [Bacteroidetes bacterium]|nr:PAS domain S-box protein [Bacteroidota bacterium]